GDSYAMMDLSVGALGYAMYGEGVLSADCYCCASDFNQAQYAAKPFAATITISTKYSFTVHRITKSTNTN
ncbi:hypothetical protein ACUODJ_59470, partial [Escherichia sp. HC-CC]